LKKSCSPCHYLLRIPSLTLFSLFSGSPFSGSTTLKGSTQSTALTSESTTSSTTIYTYAIDRFKEQDSNDDGTIYGRMSGQATHPHPDAPVPFYEARAASQVEGFHAAFCSGK
jgi:hypothetical protein